jgi:hypothetical protein
VGRAATRLRVEVRPLRVRRVPQASTVLLLGLLLRVGNVRKAPTLPEERHLLPARHVQLESTVLELGLHLPAVIVVWDHTRWAVLQRRLAHPALLELQGILSDCLPVRLVDPAPSPKPEAVSAKASSMIPSF